MGTGARSGQEPGEDLAIASWHPLSTGLTPHGLRHGHKTWMDEDQIADVLKSERLGHEEPGMRRVYGHISRAMREELKAALQARWEDSLRQRACLAKGSGRAAARQTIGWNTACPRRVSAPISLPKSDTERGVAPTVGL
jgi:hypothetical protein